LTTVQSATGVKS